MRLLALLLLFSLAASAALAGPSPATYRYTWDACDGPFNRDYAGPGVYRQVISLTGLEHPIVGYQARLRLGPVVPDAWRFDPDGCQGAAGHRVEVATRGAAGCPPVTPEPAFTSVGFSHDPPSGFAELFAEAAWFTPSTPDPASRQVLFVLDYDLTGVEAVPCRGERGAMCFISLGVSLRNPDGSRTGVWPEGRPGVSWNDPGDELYCGTHVDCFEPDPGGACCTDRCEWTSREECAARGGTFLGDCQPCAETLCLTSAAGSTWGRIKTLYR